MKNPIEHFRTGAIGRIERANRRGTYPIYGDPARDAIASVFDALEGAEVAINAIKTDERAANPAKRERGERVAASVRSAAAERLTRAKNAVDGAKKYADGLVKYPRTDAPDREARLLNARHDVDRVLQGASTTDLADRLGHLARNGGPEVRELLLADGYAERVVLPSLGRTAAVPAAQWADMKRGLLTEALGDSGERGFRLLDAAADLDAAVKIAEYATESTVKTVTQTVEGFGAPPSTPAPGGEGA
jgi:hypothetical protein